MLRLNNLQPEEGSVKKRKRIGRGKGSGQGKTAGKGHKGQKARSGVSIRPGFEGGQTPLYRRVPKRGFVNVHAATKTVLNVADLDRLDSAQYPEVSLDTLRKNRRVKGKFDRLHILGTGELSKALTVKAHKVTASAEEKIKKAGGTVEIVPPPRTHSRAIAAERKNA